MHSALLPIKNAYLGGETILTCPGVASRRMPTLFNVDQNVGNFEIDFHNKVNELNFHLTSRELMKYVER